MKILIVNSKCGYFGGVEQNIADVTRLQRAGHRFFLAWGSLTDKDVGGYRRLFESDAACAELGAADGDSMRSLVARWDPDVVYLHNVSHVEPLLPALQGRHTVRMVHDHDLCCPRGHKYFMLNGQICDRAAGWRCYADAAFIGRGPDGLHMINIQKKLREMRQNRILDRLIVASRFMRDELIMNGFSQRRVDVLPPAVDVTPLPPTPPPGTGRVIYVGQLVRGKGVDLLLSAMASVRRVFHLDIVGVGNAQDSLRTQCQRLGLADRVQFHGWVAPPDLAAMYRQADVAVVPSRWPEPFGLVGVQAMLHARATVAFDVGGIEEWLEHEETGLAVPPQDVKAFGAAVAELLDDHDMAARLGRHAYEVAIEKFSFDRYLTDLERLLAPPACVRSA